MLTKVSYSPDGYKMSDGEPAELVPDLDKVISHLVNEPQASGYKPYQFEDCPGWVFYNALNARSAHYLDNGPYNERYWVPVIHIWLDYGYLEIGGFVRAALGECGNCFSPTSWEYGYCEWCGAS